MSSAAKPPVVLLVDDDELVLASLRGVFALQTNYHLIAHTDPRDALRAAEGTPVDVVISDFLMPGLNGIDFLRALRDRQPEAARILLTGYADKENAIRAINEVGLFQYIEKPWENEGLLLAVANALDGKSLRRELADKVRALSRLVSEHDVLSDRHRFLERELEMAARVQKSLLPSAFPSLPGYRFASLYRPSEALGGDFYDVVTRPDGLSILVADVIGHGLQAALSTMLLKGIFQESAPEAPDPVELLSDMNAKLNRILPEGMYVAASVLWLGPERERFTLANAGLPYPFLLRAASKQVDEIPLGGPPLGLFGGRGLTPYEARDIAVDPGDVLLMGSDGLGSVPGAEGQYFEDTHLRASLAELTGRDGEHVVQELFERATSFSRGQKFPDDVHLLAVTRAE